jgi:hypothetical protein
MKKPRHLSLKETVSEKRIRTKGDDYTERKKKYDELKKLRNKIKEKRANHEVKVKNIIIFRSKIIEREHKRIKEERK